MVGVATAVCPGAGARGVVARLVAAAGRGAGAGGRASAPGRDRRGGGACPDAVPPPRGADRSHRASAPAGTLLGRPPPPLEPEPLCRPARGLHGTARPRAYGAGPRLRAA